MTKRKTSYQHENTYPHYQCYSSIWYSVYQIRLLWLQRIISKVRGNPSQPICNLYITMSTMQWYCWYWKFCFADETSPSSTSTATTNTATTTGLNCASFHYSNRKWLRINKTASSDIIFGTVLFYVTLMYHPTNLHFIHGHVLYVVHTYCGQIKYQTPWQCI